MELVKWLIGLVMRYVFGYVSEDKIEEAESETAAAKEALKGERDVAEVEAKIDDAQDAVTPEKEREKSDANDAFGNEDWNARG